MTCEEFAIAGLDLDSAADSPRLQAAREHLRYCPHCAALQEKWLALRAELRALGQEVRTAEAPPRVEMRLRQEFRTKHKTMKTQRAAVTASWALAATAALIIAVSWVHWRYGKNHLPTAQIGAPQSNAVSLSNAPTTSAELGETVLASNDSGDFTLLPGSLPSSLEDATVVRVEMQRAALGAFGLTVNEEYAGDLIQVDLLVGDDGLPQAVRLPPSSN